MYAFGFMEGFKLIEQAYGEGNITLQRAAQLADTLRCAVAVSRALNATKFSSRQQGRVLGIQL